MSGQPPRLLLFDCDGTLVDSHAAIVSAMQAAFRAQGLEAPEERAVAGVIGLSLAEAVARLCPEAGARAGIIAHYRSLYPKHEDSIRLFPGIAELIDELAARGYWLGIVTGKSRRGLERVLARFDWGSRFLVTRTADDCPSKPHPAMVRECADELGLDPASTAVIGDAEFDMRMAVAARSLPVGAAWAHGVDASRLSLAGARVVAHRPRDLIEHFPPLS